MDCRHPGCVMIKTVASVRELNQFIFFIRDLYKADPHYIFPIFYALKRELKKEILIEKHYQAILSYQYTKLCGRLLFTYKYSEKQKQDICYFSFFDAIDDPAVAFELFAFMESDMKSKNVLYAEGTYTPYDPDTRRGILVDGFDDDPTIFTSYNAPYYGKLLEACGYLKAYDTHALSADITSENDKKLLTLSTYFKNHFDVRVDRLNPKNLDTDIADIHQILEYATTEINYQQAPSIETITQVAKKMKLFINPKLILIARENQTGEPIGFCLVFPDFNQILKKTRGKIKPFFFLTQIKRITRARGTMQYIIPKYQSSGLIGAMYRSIGDAFLEMGITDFEAGTIMEENLRSLHTFDKFGGRIVKTYRIYGKELSI